jgi:hypothetical protein
MNSSDPLPYRPEGDDRARCDQRLDDIPAGTLVPGQYQPEIVLHDGESEIAREAVPLQIN